MRIEEKKNPVETTVILSIEDRIKLNEVFEYFKEVERKSRENIKTQSPTNSETSEVFVDFEKLKELNTFIGKLVYTPDTSNVFNTEISRVESESDDKFDKKDLFGLLLVNAGLDNPRINPIHLLKYSLNLSLKEAREIADTAPKIIYAGEVNKVREILNEFKDSTNAKLVITNKGIIPNEGFR